MANSFEEPGILPETPRAMSFQGMGLSDSDQKRVQNAVKKGKVVVRSAPKIGVFSVVCIIANRMIGTGIFSTPTTVLQLDHKIGPSLLLWFACACAALAGTLVYCEYGLTVPRWVFADQPRATPRNGGELTYLQHVLRNSSKFFASCLFGIPFIVLGNSAANAISFAYHFLLAVGGGTDKGHVQGVAIAASALICLLHGLWRRWGIDANNILATVKILMLVVIFFLAIAVVAGYKVTDKDNNNLSCHMELKSGNQTAIDNLSGSTSFQIIGNHTPRLGYAMAYLQIIYTFGGWNQANYVLGEIDNPFRNFKRTTLSTVGMISVLYILANISYLLVVPVRDNPNALDMHTCKDWNLAQKFFAMTTKSDKTYYWFLTISSLGNIIVTTFTAARVKQEIARSGVLPWSQAIANNYDIISRLRIYCQPKLKVKTTEIDGSGESTPAARATEIDRSRESIPAARATEIDRSRESTPALALVVHFMSTLILILATLSVSPTVAYGTILSIYSYAIDAFFALCLGLGILWLRLSSFYRRGKHGKGFDPEHEDWNKISEIPWWLSVPAASIMVVSNAFPIIALWIPGSSEGGSTPSVAVYATGLSLLAVGVLYWLCLYNIRPQGKERVVNRIPIFARTAQDPEHPVQQFEIFEIYWQRPDAHHNSNNNDYEQNRRVY